MALSRSIRLGDAKVPRVGLGSNRLAHSAAHVELIRAAVRAGVGHIDTAHVYAGGESETTIGEALAPFPAGCVVATKGGMGGGNGRPEVLRAEIEESLRRLRVESIALFYLHRVDPRTPLEESLGALRESRDAGRIRQVGISQVDVAQIERARAVVPIAAVQNQYNLSERGYDDVVDYCSREDIVFVPYYPVKGETPPAVDAVAARHGATPAQVKLAWLLRRAPVMLPIPGSLSLEHIRQNLAALDIELSDDDFEQLSRPG